MERETILVNNDWKNIIFKIYLLNNKKDLFFTTLTLIIIVFENVVIVKNFWLSKTLAATVCPGECKISVGGKSGSSGIKIFCVNPCPERWGTVSFRSASKPKHYPFPNSAIMKIIDFIRWLWFSPNNKPFPNEKQDPKISFGSH